MVTTNGSQKLKFKTTSIIGPNDQQTTHQCVNIYWYSSERTNESEIRTPWIGHMGVYLFVPRIQNHRQRHEMVRRCISMRHTLTLISHILTITIGAIGGILDTKSLAILLFTIEIAQSDKKGATLSPKST